MPKCSCETSQPARARRRIAAATTPFAEPFAVPEYPPREWFDRPTWVAAWRDAHGLGSDRDERGIPKITVTDDGRVGGYFYEAGQCIIHIQDACPGPSPTRYAAFMQQDAILDDGSAVKVGVIGNTHGHASPWVDYKDAQKHYADPSAQMIVCRAGDDERGGWIAGALVPGLTYGDVAMIRRCGLSGDWRPMPDAWWREHGIAAATVDDAEGYDCMGPTLVTRPALPLVKAFTASTGARAAAILGGAAGVQLAPAPRRRSDPQWATRIAATLAPVRAASWDEALHPRGDGGRFGEGNGGGTKDALADDSGTSLAERFINGESGIVLPVDQVATFTDRIAAFGKQEKESGAGTRLNLCEVSVPGTNLFCADNQGIPRQEMPQLKGEAVPGSPAALNAKGGEADVTAAFLDNLRGAGVKMTEDAVPAASLKATQSELVGEKVAGIAGAIRDGKIDIEGGERIVVSQDGYILDGHHRWGGAILNDAEDGRIGDDNVMPIYRVDMGILDLVKQANEFAAQQGIAQKGTKQGSVAAAVSRATVTKSIDRGANMAKTTVSLPDGTTIVSEEPLTPSRVSGKARRRGARVTAVVGAVDLNIADQAAEWDPAAATQRIAEWSSSDGSGSPETIDWQKFASGFFFANGDEAGPSIDAFLLPFADVVDGELQAIPAGIAAAADTVAGGAIAGASPEDMAALQERIGAYETAVSEKFGAGDAPATAAPMGDKMKMPGGPGVDSGGPGVDPAGPGVAPAGLEERVAALEQRMAACEEMMGAQMQAQVASIIAAEQPLPALS